MNEYITFIGYYIYEYITYVYCTLCSHFAVHFFHKSYMNIANKFIIIFQLNISYINNICNSIVHRAYYLLDSKEGLVLIHLNPKKYSL